MFRFSPSQLRNLLECPRCMWLKYRAGIETPRGIFPGVLGTIDRILQKETTKYAGKGKPRWLLPWVNEGVIRQGSKRFAMQRNQWILNGIVDDIILMDNGMNIIVDYKTATPYSQEKAEKYYQLQLDCYKLLLEANNLHVPDMAYLIFTIPKFLKNLSHTGHFGMDFEVTHVGLSVSAQRAEDAISKSLKICMSAKPPPASPNCKFCQYHNSLNQKDY